MDLQTFITAHAPRARQSRLAPLLRNLQELRRLGYTFAQLAEFAALMGVHTTRSNVAAYLARCALAPADRSAQRERADAGPQALPHAVPALPPAPAPAEVLSASRPTPAARSSRAVATPSPAQSPARENASAAPRRSIREIRDQARNLTDLSDRYRRHLAEHRGARK